jgi:hypothetical protein
MLPMARLEPQDLELAGLGSPDFKDCDESVRDAQSGELGLLAIGRKRSCGDRGLAL